jgi:hypothetical protein
MDLDRSNSWFLDRLLTMIERLTVLALSIVLAGCAANSRQCDAHRVTFGDAD